MNDKPTCSGCKKYGNTAAATPVHTHTRRGRYIRHAWEYATVFVPTLIEFAKGEEERRIAMGHPSISVPKNDFDTVHRTIHNVK